VFGGGGLELVLARTLRPCFSVRKISKMGGGGDVARRTIVKLEGVQYGRTELAREECLESVTLIAKQRISHARSSPSQVRSLGHTTGGYLLPVVKVIRTCRSAQGFSGTLSALSLFWKRATRNEILRGLCLYKSKLKLHFCLVLHKDENFPE
jgi:hypothetical protein